jgi:hypothetical protein
MAVARSTPIIKLANPPSGDPAKAGALPVVPVAYTLTGSQVVNIRPARLLQAS